MATPLEEKSLAKLPEEASTLERMLSAIPEGRVTALSYARELALNDDHYKEFIRDYDQNRRSDLGDLCRKHEIAPEQFLADVVKAAYPITDEAINLSKLISRTTVAKMLPKVVERGMKEGAKAAGVVDRHQTLMAEGFHLAPKGTVINMNQINQTAAGLPVFEDETKEIANILGGDVTEDHLLEGVSEESDFIEIEEVEEEKAVPV